jgi:hypothetical protein
LPVLVIALVCLLFAIIFVVMNQPAYRPVMTGVTEGDQQGRVRGPQGRGLQAHH